MAEDPSFVYEKDEETGQHVLKGLGELHLQIMKERLENEFKIKGSLTKLRVSLRETICGHFSNHETLVKKVQGYEQFFELSVDVEPVEEEEAESKNEHFGASVNGSSVIIRVPGNNEIAIDFLYSEEAANNYIKFRDYQNGGLVVPEGQDTQA